MSGNQHIKELADLKRRVSSLNKALRRSTIVAVNGEEVESSTGSETTISRVNGIEVQTVAEIDILSQRTEDLLKKSADAETSLDYTRKLLDSLWFRYCAVEGENETLKERLLELGYNSDGTKMNAAT